MLENTACHGLYFLGKVFKRLTLFIYQHQVNNDLTSNYWINKGIINGISDLNFCWVLRKMYEGFMLHILMDPVSVNAVKWADLHLQCLIGSSDGLFEVKTLCNYYKRNNDFILEHS